MTMMECSGTPCCNGGAYVFMFEASPTPLERQSAGRLLVRRAGESGVLMAGVQDCELPLYLPLEKAEIVATGILRRAPLDDAEYGNASLLTEATLCVSNPSAKGSAPPQAPSR
jgi:hypothetical protein